MRRRNLMLGMGVGLTMGLLISLAYILFPFYKEDFYRESLEAGFSTALGRTVRLEGPISLTFSLQPILILEDFHISNPPGTSRPNFFRADRLEIQVSLIPLLQGRLDVENIHLSGGDLLLEEVPVGQGNWKFGKDVGPSIWSRAVPHVFVEFSESGTLTIQDSHLGYHSLHGEESFYLAIQEASVLAIDDRLRQLSLKGSVRDVPLMVELTSGRLADLFYETAGWPIDGVLSMNETRVVVKGMFGEPASETFANLHLEVQGSRLSGLNALLKTALPDLGPYTIAGEVALTHAGTTMSHIRATVGSSDIGGQLNVHIQEGRPTLSGTVIADVIQVNDFVIPATSPHTPRSDPQPVSDVHTFSFPFDANLDITIRKGLWGEIPLGSLSLRAVIKETGIQLEPCEAKSFGGIMRARLAVDLQNVQPEYKLDAMVTSLNYGQALEAFAMTPDIVGSMDFSVNVMGHGATAQEFLKTVTVHLQAAHATIGFSGSPSERPPPVVFQQATLKVKDGGAVDVWGKGTFEAHPFAVRFQTASPLELSAAEASWPVAFMARTGEAVLVAKGILYEQPTGIGGTWAVSLKGKQLNELEAGLPPVGPYHFTAQVEKDGPRYRLHDLQSRFGSSDLAGSLEINSATAIPHVTGILTAARVNFKELSRPGDIPVPIDVIRSINGDVKLLIQHAKVGTYELAGLILDANLQDGALNLKHVQGTVLDQKYSYGNFQGMFQLDATKPIPSSSGRVALKGIKYEHIFSGVRFANVDDHVMDLDVNFSSQGVTLYTLLGGASVNLTGNNIQVMIQRGENELQPLTLRSQLRLNILEGGPVRLDIDGIVQETPFRMTSSMGKVEDLLTGTGLWPLNLRLDMPKGLIHVNGHLHLPHASDEFTLQVLIKGDTIRDLDVLGTSHLPAIGPFELNGLVTRSSVGYHMTNLEGSLAATEVKGHVTVMTQGIRPKVIGKLTAENLVAGILTSSPADSPQKGVGSILGAVTDTVTGLGSSAVDALTGKIGDAKPSVVSENTILPDWTFPVDVLQSFDLALESEIKHVRKNDQDLGHLMFRTTLEDGLLMMQPLMGTLWEGAFEGKVVLNVKSYVPTLEVNLTIHGLDYGGLMASLGGTDVIKGRSQSIKLALTGRGDTLKEVLGRANGQFELVDGPSELTTRYLDLWAADFITTALSTAWEKEPVTKLNCVVGYFDIEEGEIKSDNILIDSQRLTIAGVGKLNLSTEIMDIILTPRPKNPSLVSLAHTVRLTGPLSDPDVSRDKFRIAESGGWGLLGLVNPLGWVIAIPQIAGTTVGTMTYNPCVEAMKSRHHTVQTIEDIKGGLWGKIKKAFIKSGESSDIPPSHSE